MADEIATEPAAPATTSEPNPGDPPANDPPATDPEPGKEPGAEGEPSKTIADAPPETETAAPADWPDDWRAKIAAAVVGKEEGEDFEKELKRLNRFKSPDTVFKSFRELERAKSSGELKQEVPFPADGSEEDQAKWRQDNGLPEKPEGYLDHLDGLVIGEEDKPLADTFLQAAHEQNMPPEHVKSALDWYYKTQEQLEAERSRQDTELRSQAVEELRQEMGSEFQPNMQDLKNWLAQGPEGFMENVFGARLADGSLAGDNPDFLRFMVTQMREINPLSTVVPNAGGDQMKAVDDELAEIKKFMTEDYPAYMRDERKQARYEELLAAKERMERRG